MAMKRRSLPECTAQDQRSQLLLQSPPRELCSSDRRTFWVNGKVKNGYKLRIGPKSFTRQNL